METVHSLGGWVKRAITERARTSDENLVKYTGLSLVADATTENRRGFMLKFGDIFLEENSLTIVFCLVDGGVGRL